LLILGETELGGESKYMGGKNIGKKVEKKKSKLTRSTRITDLLYQQYLPIRKYAQKFAARSYAREKEIAEEMISRTRYISRQLFFLCIISTCNFDTKHESCSFSMFAIN